MAAQLQAIYDIIYVTDDNDDDDEFAYMHSLPLFLRSEYDDSDQSDTELESDMENENQGPQRPPRMRKMMSSPAIQERRDWLEGCYPNGPSKETLRELCAKAIAESWCQEDTFNAEMNRLGTSEMAFYFKAEVGVYLKAIYLAKFINDHGGLYKMSQRCYPEMFQRLLCAIYKEMSFMGRDKEITGRRRLSRCIQKFRQEARDSTTAALLSAHRLGLTYALTKKYRLNNDERPLLEYYDSQENRCSRMYYYPLLVYPLSKVLVIETSLAGQTAYLAPIEKIQHERSAWQRKVTPKVFCDEERGICLSAETQQRRQESYHRDSLWASVRAQSLLCRHFLLLNVMVHALFCGAPQQTIVAAFMALTDLFYAGSGMRYEDPDRAFKVHQARVDIFWYLSQALCQVHTKMDLPLACLSMATRQVNQQPLACQSEKARLVLLKLNILLRFGFYTQAQNLFGDWFERWPVSSWIHEELVLMYCAGIWHHLQDVLVEIYMTDWIHWKCEAIPCHNIHVEPMLRPVSNQLFLLKSILYRCLSNLSIRSDFRNDCKNALQICILYHYTVLKSGFRYSTIYSNELKHVYEQLYWGKTLGSSRHLEPFIETLPYSVQSEMFWEELFRKAKCGKAQEMRESSLTKMSRQTADHYFSLLVNGLFHRYKFSVAVSDTAPLLSWTEWTLEAYRHCTNNRHHRIPLLEALVQMLQRGHKKTLDGACLVTRREMPADLPRHRAALGEILSTYPNLHHPQLTLPQISAQDLTRRAIEEYAETTMRDSLNNFKNLDFGSEEVFCRYLRDRDPETMNSCIETGLQCFRFA